MKKYHAHITLQNGEGLVVPKGWKKTEIVLLDDTRTQLDIITLTLQ